MVNEEKLSAVLSEFARTMATDFPIQGILDHLVLRIVEVLPITSAGVTLISDGMAPHYIAASDDSALRFERLQTELDQGPCLRAYESGESISVPDLSADVRFARFAPAAVAAGLAAVFTFPLRHGEGCLGALDLYRDTVGELDEHDLGAAQTLADVAAAYLLNAQARVDAQATSDQFHHSSMHDPLTGLPNRALLQERLDHAGRRAKRSHANTAILFADLDQFKLVNDTYGHQVGDNLLLAVAQRLSGLVRSGDTLARVSGDEFVFLCEDLCSASDVDILLRRIGETFAHPFVLDGSDQPLIVSASVGVAFAGPGEDLSDLVVKADKAMYEVKRKDGGDRTIEPRSTRHFVAGNSLETDLRSALAQDELDVAYQPIVRSGDGIVTGVEALLRWTHPERGRVSPLSMVAVAEQSGLINDIGAWILERACRDRGQWLQSHADAPLNLAVNVSARQLSRPGFCATVASVLAATGMDPAALTLEMTENILIDDSKRVSMVLAELNDFGIRLALDDFGTGYSSLSYLGRLPIDIVKIDRCFIADIGFPPGRAIVAAVTNLARVLGLAVVAEGVETQVQRNEVEAIGCQYSQGYFYSRPMPAFAIDAHLGVVPTGPLRLPTSWKAVATAATQ